MTSLPLFTFLHWRRKRQPTPVSLPGESQGRGARWAAVYGVAQSQTRLKRLSSSSSQSCLTPCKPMDCSLPGSSVHGIFQARVLEWGASSFSRGSPHAEIKPGSPALQALPSEPPGKPTKEKEKRKGEKERYTRLNAEFQRIARRDKKAFLSD